MEDKEGSNGDVITAQQRLQDSLNEELLHASMMVYQKRQWEEGGSKGSFKAFVDRDNNAKMDEVVQGVKQLESQGCDKANSYKQALRDSYQLYYGEDGADSSTIDANISASDFFNLLDQGSFEIDPNRRSKFLAEFARQMAQLKKSGSITEFRSESFMGKLLDWVTNALRLLYFSEQGVSGKET